MSEHDHDDDEAFAEETLIQAIENQLEADNPPAAKAVYNKLTLVGYEREEILELMALVLAHEIDAMLRDDRPFDSAWYERALRALPDWQARPILALTANAFDEDRRACKAAGMDDFIVKPVDAEALYDTILRWLDGTRPGPPPGE